MDWPKPVSDEANARLAEYSRTKLGDAVAQQFRVALSADVGAPSEADLAAGVAACPVSAVTALLKCDAEIERLRAALQRLAGPAIHTDPTGPQSQSWTIMRLRTELADRRDIAREALR